MSNNQYLGRPSKESMRELPKFEGLPLDRIHLICNAEDFHFAYNEVVKSSHVGFDTESKPNFVTGQSQDGPHLLQISTQNHAFLFMSQTAIGNELLAEIIQSEEIVKVGFGLKSDRGPIFRKLGLKLHSTIELSLIIQRLGYRQKVGLQTAVAIILGQYLQKSKTTTTSNWASNTLSESQLIYAANDAYASLRVYLELAKTEPHQLGFTKN
jgi:ribonuclease D